VEFDIRDTSEGKAIAMNSPSMPGTAVPSPFGRVVFFFGESH
jgi:hypothetical protein